MKKFVLFLSLILCFQFAQAQIQGYSVGDVVDDFTVTTIDGEEVNLYEITASGQYVYIDFFFVTCGPCQVTAPHFNEFYDTYGCNEGDVFCISINTGSDTDEQVENYEETYGGDFNYAPISSGDGDSGPVDTDFNPSAYPTICLIGPDNTLLNNDIWPVSDYTTFANALIDEGFTPETMACSVTSVNDEQDQSVFSLYPNPSSDLLFIQVLKGAEIHQVEIYSLSGSLISSHDFNANSNRVEIETGALNNGLYVARIYDKDQNFSLERFSVVH